MFRITAFNGFGPSVPTYASFTTLPIAPPQPRVIKTSVTVDKCAITLSWGEGQEYLQKIKQLRQIFDVLDDDPKDGTLSRKEFKDFEDEIHKNPNLAEFLNWSGCDKETLFDFQTYDEDDNGIMTFEEFAKVLLSMVKLMQINQEFKETVILRQRQAIRVQQWQRALSSYYFNVLLTITSKYIHPWPGLLTRQTGSSPD